MISLKYALENPELVRWNTKLKGCDVNPFYDLPHYVKMVKLINETLSYHYANRKIAEKQGDREWLKYLAEEIKYERQELKKEQAEVDKIMKDLPNISAPDVPVTKGVNFKEFLESKGIQYVAP